MIKIIPIALACLGILTLLFVGSICHAQGNITTDPIYKLIQLSFKAMWIFIGLGFISTVWNRIKYKQSNLWIIMFLTIGLISFYAQMSSTPGLIFTESDMTWETMWSHLWEK